MQQWVVMVLPAPVCYTHLMLLPGVHGQKWQYSVLSTRDCWLLLKCVGVHIFHTVHCWCIIGAIYKVIDSLGNVHRIVLKKKCNYMKLTKPTAVDGDSDCSRIKSSRLRVHMHKINSDRIISRIEKAHSTSQTIWKSKIESLKYDSKLKHFFHAIWPEHTQYAFIPKQRIDSIHCVKC